MNCVIYARVSSKEQDRGGFSIPAQLELLNDYAKKNNLIVAKVFTEAETAKKAGRTAFEEMIKYIKTHNIQALLFEKTDRCYRNFKDYVTLDELQQKGLEIHLVKENTILSINSNSHEKFIHGIKVLMAKNYCDNLSEEVKKGRLKKANMGYYPSKAPVGYKNSKNSEGIGIIEIDENKAPFVTRAFQLYATGAFSIDELRKKLFSEGFNHKLKPYSKAKLLTILKDIIYIGKFKFSGIVYDGKHTPIIDIILFNQVQKMFNNDKSRQHDIEFPYTGLIKCGHCGCLLTAELKKGKYIYYHCTGKRGGNCKKDYVREEEIDTVLIELVKSIKPPDGLTDKIRKAIKEMQGHKEEFDDSSIESITKQIKALSKRIDSIYIDKLDGKITEEFWEEKNNEWHAQKTDLINKLQQLNTTSKTFYEGSNLLLNFCELVPEAFLKANAKQKKQILNLIGSNFIYKDGNLDVELTSVFDVILKLVKTDKWRERRGSNSRPHA